MLNLLFQLSFLGLFKQIFKMSIVYIRSDPNLFSLKITLGFSRIRKLIWNFFVSDFFAPTLIVHIEQSILISIYLQLLIRS